MANCDCLKRSNCNWYLSYLCCSFDNGTKDCSFSVGLKGINPDDVDKIKEIIKKTFDKVIEYVFIMQLKASFWKWCIKKNDVWSYFKIWTIIKVYYVTVVFYFLRTESHKQIPPFDVELTVTTMIITRIKPS